jgi:ribosome-binding protein aMBF1 (putative translation factor)
MEKCEICGKPATGGIGNAIHAEHYYCDDCNPLKANAPKSGATVVRWM